MLPTNDQLKVLSGMTCLKISTLLKELNVKLNKNDHRYFGACPVHGGDNITAFSLYPEGYSLPGFWKCRSHNCQQTFKPTIIGFTRGVMSRQQCGWQKSGDNLVKFGDVINFLCKKIVGQSINKIEVNAEFLHKHNFIRDVGLLKRINENKNKITQNQARTSLEIPSKYYIDRGFTQAVLEKYDVGLCNNINKEMYGRAVFPIYDDNHQYIIGCTGRSIYPSCTKCNYHHITNSKCPESNLEIIKASKWCHSKGFTTKSCLFNFWFAKKHIEKTNTVIIVESPNNVLRLEEAGIHNSVALFGIELSDEQQIILETSGAMSMIILLDNDKAGQDAIQNIKNKCNRSYKIYCPKISTNDIGDMSIEQVKQEITPVLEQIQDDSIIF